MTLTDKKIKELMRAGVLLNAEEYNVDLVHYDLRTEYFCRKEDKHMLDVCLKPGDSVFVQSVEIINLPKDMLARVILRNSRIRQGLSIEAPVYFPGHNTKVFFRVTNVSADEITLDTEKGIASIMFEQLEEEPEEKYSGSFQGEMVFSDMASYKDTYKEEIKELKKETDKLENMESRLYANVITILTVFVGIFSLINVNVSAAYTEAFTTAKLIVFNLATVGSVAVMTGLLHNFFQKKSKCAVWVAIGIALLCFAVAIVMQVKCLSR